MRLFQLKRLDDLGASPGAVLLGEGVEFDDCQVVLKWTARVQSVGTYPNVEEMIEDHGGEGITRVIWLDEQGDGIR